MFQIFKILIISIVWLPQNNVHSAERVPVLVAPFDAGPLAGDTILMNQMIKADAPTILVPQETPGYLYNIREMARSKRWATTLFNTEDTILNWLSTVDPTALRNFYHNQSRSALNYSIVKHGGVAARSL